MHDKPLADLAIRHLEDFAPLIMDLSDVLPSVVLSELVRAGKVVADNTVAQEAARNARNAWMQSASVH